jgi:hypothetical protein
MTETPISISSFHDGKLTSVAVGEGTATLGLTHLDGRRFTLSMAGVEALSINDFREGNIVLELHLLTGTSFEKAGFSPGDVRASLQVLFTAPHPDAAQKYHDDYNSSLDRQIERLRDGSMKLIILDPAYGADLLAYCATADLAALDAQ